MPEGLDTSIARRACAVAAIALILAACDREKNTGSPAKATPPPTAEEKARGEKMWNRLLGLERLRAPAEKPTSPQLAASARTLADVVSGFQSYSSCLGRLRHQLPPDLSADMLTYLKNVPDGLCRTREAMSRSQLSSCDSIRNYQMKRGCKVMYAIYARTAAACPLTYRGRRGRDGYCVALAERNPSLCATAKNDELEARCKAILAGSDAACHGLTPAGKREQCSAEVHRWKGVATGAQPSRPDGWRPSLELTLTSSPGGGVATAPSGGVGTAPTNQKVTPTCAVLGAVAPSAGDAHHVNFCSYNMYSYRRSRRSGYGRRQNYAYRYARVDFSFKPPASPTDVIQFGQDAQFGIKVTRIGEYRTNPVGEIRFTAFERKRGGRVAGSFKVTVNGSRGAMTVEGKFDSVVRDLVEPAKMRRRASYRKTGGRSGLSGLRPRRPTGGSGLLSSGIRKLGGPGRRHPTTSEKRFAALLTAATLKRTTAGGKTGFELRAIVYDSIWDRLGLKNGDVLLQAGKLKIANKAAVIRLRKELSAAKSLRLRVRRSNRETTMVIGLPTLERIRKDFFFN